MTLVGRRAVRHHGLYCYCCLWIGACVWSVFAFAHSLQDSYSRARQALVQEGHAAAQPLYADLLRRQHHPSWRKGDLTTATRLAASTGELWRCWQNACGDHRIDDRRQLNDTLRQLRAWFLDSQYTTRGVGTVLSIPAHQATARAPVYVSPAAAGAVTDRNYPFALDGSLATLQCLVALFLLGLAVPEKIAKQACSPHKLQLLYDLGLVAHCDHDPTVLVAVVSIMPVDLTMMRTHSDCASSADDSARRHLYVVTDWHPRVLNTIQITDDEEAVMYIGPDSLALVQHWLLHPASAFPYHSSDAAAAEDHDDVARTCWLDLCTGSGIQALAALALKKCQSVVCVDLNPRALRFTAFSAALNGLRVLNGNDDDDAVTLVQGNLLDGTGRVVSVPGHGTASSSSSVSLQQESNLALIDLLRNLWEPGYDAITANPPFLPVPPSSAAAADTGATAKDMIAARHGLFSAGGSSGEAVLAAILSLSRCLLKPNGYAAVVSEFFFPPAADDSNTSDTLLERLQAYWSDRSSASHATFPANCKALLLTNQHPISAQLYAQRRADSPEEVTAWLEHLQREHIATCSPGLLYVQKTTVAQESVWQHVVVPKSEFGSIWTPSNTEAVQLTQATSASFFHW